MAVFVGVAGWSIPSRLAHLFPGEGTHLERYARQLPAVEINSSFYRPHRRATYERWADGVPDDFRFAVKMPRTVTHAARLAGCGPLLERFFGEIGGLGRHLGPILVQLPPSLGLDLGTAGTFLATLRTLTDGPVVLEPRHAAWFAPDADGLLASQRIARVAADPARHAGAGIPGGWTKTAYWRLHGSPRMYESDYGPEAVVAQAGSVRASVSEGAEAWTIYDNTTFGFALENAIELCRQLARDESLPEPSQDKSDAKSREN